MFDTKQTQWFMSASAIFMGIIGIGASFLPQELLTALEASASNISTMVLQLMGALYVGLAMLNWTARTNIIGAIYSRPVALCNFGHFFIVSIILLKQGSLPSHAIIFWIITLINIFFAVGFGYLLFFRGKTKQSGQHC